MITGYKIPRLYIVLTVLTFTLILITETLVWQIDKTLRSGAESRLIEEASDMRALLEAEISEGIYITIGVESFIRSRGGDLSLQDVELWMAALFENTRHLRNIGIAPDNVISAIFPREGNEAVVGLDYRELTAQWPAIETMMATGQSSLVGPVDLVQGGVALIYRRPVFVNRQYWGLISTVMELESILNILDSSTEKMTSNYLIRTTEANGHTPIAGGFSPSANRISRSLIMELQGDFQWELIVSERSIVWPLWSARLLLWSMGLLLLLYGRQWHLARELQLQTNREKIDFIHTISHELRTPLTSISGALALLGRETQTSAANERLLLLATRNTKRLERLVSEVLDVARLDASRMSFTLEHLAIGPILQQAVENNASFGRAQGVELSLHPDAARTLVCVNADEQRLLQILDNLLSNAIKFSDEGQSVEVSMDEKPNHIEIHVQDYGIGIPSSFQARLFERFARADHSDARRNQSGTGLGLNISRNLAIHMGGNITVVSKEQEGSCFTLTLPAVGSEA